MDNSLVVNVRNGTDNLLENLPSIEFVYSALFLNVFIKLPSSAEFHDHDHRFLGELHEGFLQPNDVSVVEFL